VTFRGINLASTYGMNSLNHHMINRHMINRLSAFSLFLCLLLAMPTTFVFASPRGEIYRHAKSATVLIIGSNDAEHSLSLGSGFFITENGILVTNAHIVEDSSRLVIYVGDQAIFQNPDVLLVDRDADLAVLRIPTTQVDSLFLATELPEESTPVIAVGYPRLTDVLNIGFALHSTIAPGSINGTAEGRTRTQGRHATFLQMTGVLNSGNSGGPIINTDSGEAVGMVTQTVPFVERARDGDGKVLGSVMMRSGIGYAIPATRIRLWLLEHGIVTPAQLSHSSSAARSSRVDDALVSANRSFATGHLVHTMALVLSKDSDLLELAVSHYEAALEQHRGASWIMCNLGMAYFFLGKKDKAAAKFAEAFQNDPTSATAAYHLGQQNDSPNMWDVILAKLPLSADQNEWNTNMREAVTRAKLVSTSIAAPVNKNK
jgi:S1-C subfamily serine protease